MPTPEDDKKKKKEEEAQVTPEDEFDQAWNEPEDGDPNPDSDDNEGENEGENTDDDNSDGSLFNPPDDGQDAGQGDEEGTLEEQNQKLIQKMKSWEGRITAANKRAAEAEAALAALQKADQGANTDDDSTPPAGDNDASEEEVLKDFMEEFPALDKPVRLMIKKIVKNAVEKRIGPVEQTVQSVTATVNDEASERHIRAITEAHEDWQDIYQSGKLQAWIDSQPAFIQPSLNQVVTDGDTKDVIEMFDQYKRSLGTSKAPASNSTPTKTSTKDQRVASMQPVPAASAGPPEGKKEIAEDDFDAAWDDALAND